MRHLSPADDAATIAERVLGRRERPLVLISTAPDGGFGYDPAEVARELGADADVITVVTGETTKALEGLLPSRAHAYGGAARSFPPDFGRDPDWRRSPLRFPGRNPVDDLVDDALTQAGPRVVAAPPPRRVWTTGTIERLSGDTGTIATLSTGDRAIVVADNLPVDLRLGEALVEGGPVAGWLTGLDLAPEPAEVDLGRFTDGDVTLARVVKVTSRRATLRVHPGSSDFVLRRRDIVPGADDGEDDDGASVTDLVHVGQTLRARVMRGHDGLGLSLVGVDLDAPLVEPLSLIRGGPPWLHEGVDGPEAHADDPAGPSEAPGASEAVAESAANGASAVDGTRSGTTKSEHAEAADDDRIAPQRDHGAPTPRTTAEPSVVLDGLRDEVQQLRGAILRLGQDLRVGTDLESLDRLRDEAATLAAELGREQKLRSEREITIAGLRIELREARSARTESGGGGRRTPVDAWPDGVDWLLFEVAATWAVRTTADDKVRHPLGVFAVGPEFLSSLAPLDDAQLDKTLRTIVDVVSGRAAGIAGRRLHRLRQGRGGGDPFVVRADGATCWRASIESNAASARRLHYWQLPGGTIELGRVVLHDDTRP